MNHSTTKCHCGVASVGFITNFQENRYYCNTHWWLMSKKVDAWINAQYQKQWADLDWFKELATPKRKTGKQFKLL